MASTTPEVFRCWLVKSPRCSMQRAKTPRRSGVDGGGDDAPSSPAAVVNSAVMGLTTFAAETNLRMFKTF